MEGVLKSWAIPKGPSLNPEDKRLAVMVEDHPFDYRTFEGIIPPGNYGAGTVIVWDEGTYEPSEAEGSVKEQEKALLKQLNSGNLKIRLHGKKLNGDYALVRTKGMEENAWLLIKKNDEFASSKDVTKKDASVKSGKTIKQMSAGSTIKQSPGKTTTTKKNVSKKTATKKTASKNAVKKKSSPVKKKSAAAK